MRIFRLFAAALISSVGAPASAIVISEVMYHPAADESRYEWVEIYNEKPGRRDLSLWQFTDGTPVWLDEEEFDEAVTTGLIDKPLEKQILNQRTLIEMQVKLGAWPPPVAKDIDLAQAEALLYA